MSIFSSIISRKKNNIEINDNSSSSEAKFVLDMKKKKIGLKSALMEYAAKSRNVDVERLSRRVIVVKPKKGDYFSFTQMNGNHSSYVGMHICNRKQDTRKLLEEKGLKVVESKKFSEKDLNKGLAFAEKIGYPVVIKPTTLSRGRGVTTNIQNEKEFEIAWNHAISAYVKSRKTKDVLVERYIKGEDFRVFVVNDKVVSVTQRKRANVVGDGKSTVLELIKEKNKERSNNPYLSNHLISEDANELDRLRQQNYTLDYIPKAGEEIVLRNQSNISAGGDSVDFTDKIHPEFIDIAIKSIQAIPGIKYAGVDFIAEDITKKPSKTEYVVSEIEFSPAPLAQFPYKGKSRDIAGAILDYYLANNK